MTTTSTNVIASAPVATAIASWLVLLAIYVSAPWSVTLDVLALVLCAMTLGALTVSYPKSF